MSNTAQKTKTGGTGDKGRTPAGRPLLENAHTKVVKERLLDAIGGIQSDVSDLYRMGRRAVPGLVEAMKNEEMQGEAAFVLTMIGAMERLDEIPEVVAAVWDPEMSIFGRVTSAQLIIAAKKLRGEAVPPEVEFMVLAGRMDCDRAVELCFFSLEFPDSDPVKKAINDANEQVYEFGNRVLVQRWLGHIAEKVERLD